MSKNKSILYKLSDSEFISLFKQSHSYSEILRAVGLSASGSASRTVLLARMKQLHLTREDLSKERIKRGARNTLEEDKIFQKGVYIAGNTLKKHYLKNRQDSYQCDVCGITTWNNKPLVLHLDHINGIKTDNRLTNLRLLCPNCDSQMTTYRGKNIKLPFTRPKKKCVLCGKTITIGAVYCKKCSSKINALNTRRFVIDRNDLKTLIRTQPFTTIAKNYKVSDNAIRKRCKAFNLPFRSKDIKQYTDEEWLKV